MGTPTPLTPLASPSAESSTTTSTHAFFLVNLPPQQEDIVITLGENFGYLGFAVKIGVAGGWPTQQDNDFPSQDSTFRNVLIIRGEDIEANKFTEGEKMRIRVESFGGTEGKGTLLVSSESTTVSLTNGVPTLFVVKSAVASTDPATLISRSESFSFTTTSSGLLGTGEEYLVSVSPLGGGDPNLVIYDGTGGISPGSCDGVHSVCSARSGYDFVKVPRSGTWNAYVSSSLAADESAGSTNYCIFTVLASSARVGEPTKLLAGVTQDDSVGDNKARYFLVDVPEGGEEFKIVVNPLTSTSNPDIYIRPGTNFYQPGSNNYPPIWSSVSLSTTVESVTIEPDDSNALKEGGTYAVTVYGVESGVPANMNEFSITPSFPTTTVFLREGFPITETLLNGHYRYYQFFDSRDAGDLIIDVTPFFGDPDMYVGCHLDATDSVEGFPSSAQGHHNFSSTMMYEDSLVIPASSPNR